MGLRNAFDGLATESGLRRIVNLLTFARDNNDRIRTIVDGGSLTIYNRASGTNMTNDNSTSYQSSLSWNSVDARDPLRQQHRSTTNYTRQTRWTIS